MKNKMIKKIGIKVASITLIISILLSTNVFAAPVQQVKYIYFQNTNAESVIVDYMQAIDAAISGDSTLYNSLKSFLASAVGFGLPIVLETTIGTVLDYQKALIQNKPNLIDFQDNITFQTEKPVYTKELNVVNGAAALVTVVIPVAPAVTNDDTANTVNGMVTGLEYNLDGSGYVAYNSTVFNALSFAGEHILLVRVAPSGTTPAGHITTLTFTTNPVTPPAPNVTADDTANTVSGITAGMEYSLDGAAYVAYDPITFSAINFSGSHILRVRIAVSGINPAGPDTVLTFTASVAELAELAVSAYEAAPITTLAEVATAEGLKPAADQAVAAVLDAILKTSLENRIAVRAAAIQTAKDSLNQNEAQNIAAAETAVAAYEAAPITNILQINNSAVLLTDAQTKTANVGTVAVRDGFTQRINTKLTSVAVAEFNLVTYVSQMDSSIRNRAAVIGLNLTNYNLLGNKVPVQTAMLTPVFVTAADVKSTFDAAVSAQAAIETSVVTVFNNAGTAAEIAAAITTHSSELQLDLTEYNALTNKVNVQNALLAPTFTAGEEIKLAFLIAVMNNTNDAGVKSILYNNSIIFGLGLTSEYTLLSTRYIVENAMIAAKPILDKTEIVVTALNSTVLSGYIGQLLPINQTLLGLDLTGYNTLIWRNKMVVHDALLNAPLAGVSDVQTVFNASVAERMAFETAGVAAFNNAADSVAMAAAIATYIAVTDQGNYPGLIDKEPVHVALIAQSFSSLEQVKTAFDTAVTAQKAVETSVISAVNNAPDASSMGTVLVNNAVSLGLNLTDYNLLPESDKLIVNEALLATTFYSVASIKTAFDTAVNTQKAILAVNTATEANIGTVLATYATALGLNLSDYNVLSASSIADVNTAMVGKAFANKTAVQTALETAVALPIINEITTATAMGTAITRYASILGLNLVAYSSLPASYKTQVNDAMIAPVFSTTAEVQTVFNEAVTAAREANAVALVNSAATTSYMNSILTSYASVLGLNLTAYNALDATKKTAVQTTLMTPVFTNAAEVKAAFDAAVAAQNPVPVTPPAPNVTNDDDANTVSGMAAGMEYSLDGAAYVAYDPAVFGAIDFSGDHTLLVRVATEGINPAGPDTTLTFTTNTVPLAMMLITPALITPTEPAVTVDDTANTVSGMAAGMEYSLDGAAYVAYDPAVFGAIDFSGNHTLLVRVAAEGINPAGPDTTLVFTTNPVPVTTSAPNVTADDTANTVSGMAAGMEYSLDGAAYVAYDPAVFGAIDFSGNHTLLVRVAAEGINPFSPETTLTFTTNPDPINPDVNG